MRHAPTTRAGLALAAVGALFAGTLGLDPAAAAHVSTGHSPGQHSTEQFSRLSTYPVFENVPDDVDPTDPTVAEISSVSPDGNTLAYTDAAGGRIGFLDITDPSDPVGLGSHDVSGGTGGSPTSVAITASSAGDVALVVVDDSTYPGLEDTAWEDEDPAIGTRAGHLDVVTVDGDHQILHTIDLAGQPDSIAISPDGRYAAIAMENQRNEAYTPDGGEEGDLPQAPAGFLQVIDLTDDDPTTWTTTPVELPVDAMTDAGLDTPEDAEPEYVDINADDQLAMTLQENNGVVIVDLPSVIDDPDNASAAVTSVWSAGNDRVSGIDATSDGIFDPVDTVDKPREPDAIQWVGTDADGNDLVATANEGDWKGGTRGWTVFDAATGEVVWDAGNGFERLATRYGLFNDDRAAKKGTEPEGMAFDEIDGTPYAFVGSERSNFVAVYDMTDPTKPTFTQVLPATNGPEGLLPIPSRNLIAISSETDDASVLVRASVSLYRLGDDPATFPSIESDIGSDGAPIGWGALGALSAVPGNDHVLYAASDNAYATGRIYKIDTGVSPAQIVGVREVREADGTLIDDDSIDIEGLYARPEGGFWAANEGATGDANSLLRLDDAGRIQETVSLPTEISSKIGKWGLEGVTAVGSGESEQVYVAVQRPLWTDSTATTQGMDGNVTRIGRYTPATGTWEWFGFPLDTTSVSGDWIGVSEIAAVDADTLAVVERDKQNGTTAAIKRVYTVDIPATGVSGDEAITAPLTTTLAHDVLPDLQATHGWTQEKLEGLTIGADHQVYAVTDNDGLVDATGETVFMRLGSLSTVFADATATTTKLALPTTRVRAGSTVRVGVSVSPAAAGETVTLLDGGRAVGAGTLDAAGKATIAYTAAKVGRHSLTATYAGSDTLAASTSAVARLTVTKAATKATLKAPTRATTTKRITLRAVLSPKAATGKVTFFDGAGRLGTVAVGNGVATLSVRLGRGRHTVSATYAGTATYAAARTGRATITVTI
ncbi:MAG: esterase-like activity of phytase family protein [Nocardioides sp.]|uniref:esterase-like activity of phytase family protein n=1 Tax=Nocardioides sp. TaxID=35761 RepID=UPI0039E22D28